MQMRVIYGSSGVFFFCSPLAVVEQEHGAVLDGLEVVDVSVDVLDEVVKNYCVDCVQSLPLLAVDGPRQVVVSQVVLQRLRPKPEHTRVRVTFLVSHSTYM